MTRAFKFLSAGGIGLFSGFCWPQGNDGGPGSWVEARGELSSCGNGIHACRTDDLPYWIDDELWVVELDGEIVPAERGLIARRGRLIRRVDAWNGGTAVELARVCTARSTLQAADVLTASGLSGDAEGLRGIADLAGLHAALVALFESTEGFPGLVAGYAADVAQYALDAESDGADWAACAAYVDAFLAGFVASGGRAKHPDHERAFFDIRRDQARWFVERFDL